VPCKPRHTNNLHATPKIPLSARPSLFALVPERERRQALVDSGPLSGPRLCNRTPADFQVRIGFSRPCRVSPRCCCRGQAGGRARTHSLSIVSLHHRLHRSVTAPWHPSPPLLTPTHYLCMSGDGGAPCSTRSLEMLRHQASNLGRSPRGCRRGSSKHHPSSPSESAEASELSGAVPSRYRKLFSLNSRVRVAEQAGRRVTRWPMPPSQCSKSWRLNAPTPGPTNRAAMAAPRHASHI
jgi:hypothetical protein